MKNMKIDANGTEIRVLGDVVNEDAYIFDQKTGEISRSEDYGGVNALFELPLDPALADTEAAEEYLEVFERNSGESAEEGSEEDAYALGSKEAEAFMDTRQALAAAEIVYALTNDKGRTRDERAGAHYYAGIRETPYAPFVKLCDRLANMTYSFRGTDIANRHMKEVYRREWPHFIASVNPHAGDIRFSIPADMVREAECLLAERER